LPSPTTPPLAALVNGDPITLAEYQAELGRYQAASGTELATEDQQRVFDELVDQLLLEQAAYESGFALDEAGLQQRYDALVSQLGNAQKLQEWMAANGYTQESFRQSLRRAAAAAWMRDQIAASVPLTVEQVHARQILLYNSEEAESVFAQLGAGADFAELADQYDPAAGGDLGWFPPGYLLDSKLDEAVFSLQPGAYSPIVQTGAGYHILQLLERDPQRPLEPGARLRLQFKTLNDWMATRRSQSQIQVLLP
jgi:parvulin-like peptidyl-prolyl isomerase